MRPIIIDLDGVLVDFNLPFWHVLAAQGAPMIPFENGEPRTWHWEALYGASSAHVDAAWAQVAEDPVWWAELPKHTDVAKADLHWWHGAVGRPVIYCSARPHQVLSGSEWWLHDHVCEAVPTLLHAPGPQRKPRVLQGLSPVAILEDKWDTLAICARKIATGEMDPCRLLLVDRPYNHAAPHPMIERVASTPAALKLVEAL